MEAESLSEIMIGAGNAPVSRISPMETSLDIGLPWLSDRRS
nr:hypothetical protein [Candidatus Sigynarchaeota archaeon]